MSMNELLAQHYGTNKLASAPPAEAPAATLGDMSKEAQVELFVKMAAENGIDLDTLNDEQTAHLFNETFKKEASAAPAAAAPPAADADFQAKLAQADFFGRQMAHAYVAELAEIAQTKQASAVAKVASAVKTAEEKEKEEKEKKEKGDGDKDDGKGEKKLPPWMMDKKASAEVLAGQVAVQYIVDFNKTAAPEARYNEWQAVDRVGAVLTLGAPSEKTATVVDAEGRVHMQALEILEAAGYPVSWKK